MMFLETPFIHRIKLQNGIILPLMVISIPVFMIMAGLVLDIGHLYVNKSRLQNAVDAAALSAAETLITNDPGKDPTDYGFAAFVQTLEGDGNQELASTAIIPSFEYSYKAIPFVDTAIGGVPSPNFVRVTANYNQPSIIIHMIGFDTLDITVTAMAGPSTFTAGPLPNFPAVLYPDLN
jgi:uncharacterized membrane protein